MGLGFLFCQGYKDLRNLNYDLQGWFKLPLQISFQNGTCYTVEECNRRNGINSGSCAGGYGVCCACMFAVLPTQTVSIDF